MHGSVCEAKVFKRQYEGEVNFFRGVLVISNWRRLFAKKTKNCNIKVLQKFHATQNRLYYVFLWFLIKCMFVFRSLKWLAMLWYMYMIALGSLSLDTA